MGEGARRVAHVTGHELVSMNKADWAGCGVSLCPGNRGAVEVWRCPQTSSRFFPTVYLCQVLSRSLDVGVWLSQSLKSGRMHAHAGELGSRNPVLTLTEFCWDKGFPEVGFVEGEQTLGAGNTIWEPVFRLSTKAFPVIARSFRKQCGFTPTQRWLGWD